MNISIQQKDLMLPNPSDVIGPYSLWPQRKPKRRPMPKRLIVSGVLATSLGVFIHCGLPLIA